MKFTEQQLEKLRSEIENSDEISDKRKTHVLAVEKMAIRLGGLYLPEKIDVLRAAALLHDMTKEYETERQIKILESHRHAVMPFERYAPKTLHAMTAALLIPEKYPDFADPEVISAVRWHTTGHCGMTLPEKLIYLSDYIDESRSFSDCVTLRNMFFDADPDSMTREGREKLLRDVLITSYDMTVSALLGSGFPISPDTIYALNELICFKIKNEAKA